MKGNFSQLINSEKPVLIDFSAEWCGPCKVQAPILLEVARELDGKIKIITIDVDKNPEIAARYQVRGVPTLALFKKGQNVWRQSGVMDKNSLIGVISAHLS